MSHGQWTDNVARVYAVRQRHPEITLVFPWDVEGIKFGAYWPGGDVQTEQLCELADILERKFPVGDGG